MPRGVYKHPTQCGFQKGHSFYEGGEKGWIKKGDKLGLGYKHTKESKDKMSEATKGQSRSPATQFKKGQTAWNKDKKCPQLSGENHYLWKGGISTLSQAVRGCAKGKQWITNVFQRDNWTCQTCGARSARGQAVLLNAHHIRPFADIIEYCEIISLKEALKCKMLWNTDNGVTLCVDCHKLAHKGVNKQ